MKESEPVKSCGITMETLADYREGRTDAGMTAQVRAHLDRDCAHCRQNLGWLQHAVETLRQAHTAQVPEAALTRAQAIFRERFHPMPVPNSLQSWLGESSWSTARMCMI